VSDRDSLHRYRLDECVGVGGMAQVFRATALGAEGFEKKVAIKRILPNLAGASFQRRFVNEAKLTAQLTHPNIVQIIDFGRTDGALYIAMEYVDGVDLLVLIRSGQVPLSAALFIALAICRGLSFAHDNGVIHRDVSPSNILLSATGAVKVADFGIAHTIDMESAPMQIIGKLSYMSPEQTRGEVLDSRTDVFSAGIVIHELMTSHRLFRGSTFEAVQDAITTMPIPLVQSLRDDCPPGFDAILARMLARDREQRTPRLRDVEKEIIALCRSNNLFPSESDVADAVARVKGSTTPDRDAAVRALFARAAGAAPPRRGTEAGTDHELPQVQDPTGATLLIRRAASGHAAELDLEPAGSALTDASTTSLLPASTTMPTRPRRRWLLVALPIVAIAGGALAGYAWLGRATPAAAPVVAVHPALDAPELDASAPDAPVQLPLDASVTDASLAVETPDAEGSAAGPADPVAVRTTYTIQISAVPWAHVYLGTRKLGTSPSQRRFKLPRGSHTLTLTNPELGLTRKVNVVVPSDQIYRFDLR
jgi:serine/threonine-protein kinase